MGATPASTRGERVLLLAILAAGVALRLWLVLGPFAEIDADEAVVGLMALNVPGELPVFYWEQHYLGALEAYVAAGLFALVGPSAAALKLVPTVFSMLFVGLSYVAARPVFGAGPALASALYLAVPPSFFAAWSVKARGGYAEALAFGMLFLIAAQRLADRSSASGWRTAAVAGLAAGVGLWTHPMSAVMVAAGALYVLLAWRTEPDGIPHARVSGLLPWQGPGCWSGRRRRSSTTSLTAFRACASRPTAAPSRGPRSSTCGG